MKIYKKILAVLALLLMLSLACGLPIAPTAESSQNNSDSETATTPSTAPPATATDEITPSVEISASPTQEATAIPTAALNSNCVNNSEFVADITIPDGTLVAPGQSFTKTWAILNNGTCTWTPQYKWVQISGSALSATPTQQSLSKTVAPGETLEISVSISLSASAEVGNRYQSQFQLADPNGAKFGTHPFALVYASPGVGVCPIPYGNYLAYISAAQGFCFLYPDDYTMNNVFNNPDRLGVQITAPHPGGGGEVMLASLGVNVEGPTGGLGSSDYKNVIINDWKAPATTPAVEVIDLDGEAAYYTDDLPGMVGNRIMITVHNGTGFIFTILPIDNSFATQTADAEILFDLVVDTFAWINP